MQFRAASDARAKGAFQLLQLLSAEIAVVAETAVVGEQAQGLFTVIRSLG